MADAIYPRTVAATANPIDEFRNARAIRSCNDDELDLVSLVRLIAAKRQAEHNRRSNSRMATTVFAGLPSTPVCQMDPIEIAQMLVE
jgi:hypothetical protein